MRLNKKISIAVIIATSSFFLIAWNPLKPILNYFTSVFSSGETSIPLPLPNIQIGITGKPSFSLSIQVPPGAGDLVPSITIDYTGGNTQSILGSGWNLGGFPRILKNPNLGVHFGTTDGYSSSVLGELVETSTSGVYRSKMESFYKIKLDGNVWVFQDKSGITYEYGRNDSSGSESIVLSNSVTITSYLDKVRDSFGNGYDIVYNSDSAISDEPLPKEIKYARGNGRIVFSYKDRSSDFREQIFYLTKAVFRKKLLDKIDVYAKDSSGSEQLIETYNFSYEITDLGPILSSYERENYKPINFSYLERSTQADLFNSNGKNYNVSYQAINPNVQSSCAATQSACLCSASAACMAATVGAAGILCAQGIASFQDVCTNGVTSTFVTPADTDGDGIPELVKVTGTMTNQKFSISKLSDWENVNSSPISANTNTIGSHIGITSIGRILPGDFNGDGKSDFLILKNNGEALKVYYGPDFISASYSNVSAQNLGSSNSKHFITDVNGDGKTDFIQVDKNNDFLVYASTGSGFQKIQTLTISTYGTSFHQFVDLDRNGVPDFIRINDSNSQELIVTFLDFKNGLLQEIETNKITRPDFGKYGDQFLSDLNGDGYLDFAFFSMPGSQGSISYYPFTGRIFQTNGASPLQTINVNGAFANKEPGSSTSKVYVEVDLSGDGVKDRISYDNTDIFNPFFNVEIYDLTNSKYLTAFKLYWNQDVSKDLNGDSVLDTLRADVTSEQRTDSNGLITTVNTSKFIVTIANASPYDVAIDLDSYIPSTSSSGDSSSISYFNWMNRKDFIDLNGDGKADFLRYDASNGVLAVSYARLDSNGYITYSLDGEDSWTTGGYFQALDTNGDGKPEFLGLKGNKVNFQTSVTSSAPGILTTAWRSFPYESNLELHYIRFNQALPSGLLSKIENGAYSSQGNLELNLEYQLAKNHPGAIQPNLYNSASPQFVPFGGADYLTTKLVQKTGNTILSSGSYTYSFARFYLGGFRNSSYIGFQKMTQNDSILNQTIKVEYNPSFIEMSGKPTYQRIETNGIPISESTWSYNKSISNFGSILVLSGDASEVKYQGGNALSSSLISKTYDSYGNVLNKVTSINGTLLAEKTTYLNDWSQSIIGKPIEIQVLKDGELLSDKKLNYSGRSLSEVHELISEGVWRSQFIQAYDEYGNPTSVLDSNGNTNSIEYDSVVHKYPLKTTNSLGHISLKQYDLTTGLELSTTNSNGGVSKTDYDTFGRAVLSYLPGESDWSEKVEYENTGDLENKLVRKSFRRNGGSSWEEESSNLISGVSKKRSSLVNGYVLVEEVYYNPKGLTLKKVDSYLEGSTPFSWTNYTYDAEGNLILSERNDGHSTSISINGWTATTKEFNNGNAIRENIEIKNVFGQTISVTQQGKTIQYKYASNGKISQLIDSENGITYIQNDFAGRQTKVISPNSGTTQFVYDSNSGNLNKQRLASGSEIQYSYDVLGRVLQATGVGPQGETVNQIFEYDSASVSNGIGRLTKVTDSLGTTEFEYDIRGNQIVIKKNLVDENLTLIVKRKYNLQGQVEEITYPDGSVAKNLYSEAGYLSAVTLDPADGSGTDFPVVQYAGPIVENGLLKIQRILGNGVNTNIYYDPVKKNLVRIQTSKDSSSYQDLNYTYDNYGNHSSITDSLTPTRSQSFTYDSLNRLTSAVGIYGIEEYQYSDSGKLLKKGNSTYSYLDSSHKNAVTDVSGDSISYHYTYDSAGNVLSKNDEEFAYNPFQKLERINTSNGETIKFDYDFTGTRIRKTRSSDGTKTITLGGLYEVVLASAKPPQHTLYFRGNSGDLVGQWSRQNPDLISYGNQELLASSGIGATWNTYLWQSKDLTIRGIKYLLFVPGANIVFLYVTIFLGVGFALLSFGDGLWRLTIKFVIPLMLVSFSNCSITLPGSSGNAPWTILPFIESGTTGVGSPYEPGSGAGMPVAGFLFLHPDHLGSIVMATDGLGNRVTGGEQSGASNVSYKPYGEIQREDSFGPDVFRYKYTAQEEDRETGLYYYKARYYDPIIGRFLQADSLIDSSRPMGMDLYMYTEGNPISYTDPSGHSVFSSWLSKNGLGFLNFQLTLTNALLILNPVGMLASAIAVGMAGASVIAIAGATALGLGIAASVIVGSTIVMGSAALAIISVGSAVIGGSAVMMGLSAAAIVGAAGLAIGASALGFISGIAAAAVIAGVSVVLMAGAVAMTAAGAAIIVGLAAIAVAAVLVFTAVVLAIAAALVAIAVIPILAATALAVGGAAVIVGGMAIGSILSFWTLQAYVAGGFSKSSFNNIHWNERSARQGACYAAAGQFGGMLAGAGIVGYPIASGAIPWLEPALTGLGYGMTLRSAIMEDWKSFGAAMVGFAIKAYKDVTIPVGLILDYAEGTSRTCGGIE
ncbi:RHS repeat-associated core domain-containing protein [Leptospira licerasiae]|uniref:RHS repeat-associated core domain protein n=1 Tax=Leptospira licerasiae str. MMD4847 TaxID=1049971 RepID=A0ABP2RJC3_9LEPT|nr:RHS repeat-associated core domain-containing protein [Leptospira licerasiae]EIE01556.1 RHS repeat-associated core domain protein [Leptospira licerasiae serovar Varillal str. VAR 010]EJZ43569.1 RHS repeat-associated core domain protein [Leptospira licerasiae str. MMD4847]